jgi:hypothetical protein
MNESRSPAWCQDLGQLSDRQLEVLVDCAAAVLAEGAGENADARDIRELPPAVLAPDLTRALAEAGVRADEHEVERLAEEAASARTLAIALLREICAVPVLRSEVDAAYEASQRMMLADPVTITAISLLLLVMKLRRVKVGKEGVEVTLDPIRNGIRGVIKDLTSG